MVHDLSPFVWKISGEFGIRWYGLSYLFAFFCAFVLVSWLSQRQRNGLTSQMILDFVIFSAIGTLIGGRLGYCIFYAPDLFLKFRPDFPFWGVLALNEGGMASHGGIVGLVLALTLFSLKSGVGQLYLFDLAALCGSLGIFFGRLANFVNGELVGRVVDSSYALAVKFPQDILFWPQYDFKKLASLNTVIEKIPELQTVVTPEEWAKLSEAGSMTEASRIKITVVLNQILTAIQGGNEGAKLAVAPLLDYRHPSQLYGAFGEGLFIFLCLFVIWYKPRRSGIIAAWFILLYSIVRLVDEQFRLPDPQLGFRWLELTQGQWLSIGTLIIGLWWMVIFIGRRETIASPGWGLGPNVRIHRRH